MTSERLTATLPKSVGQFDVIGVDGNVPEFVTHVGLATTLRTGVVAGASVPLLHMQPPLAYSLVGSQASVWGAVGLTVNEIRKISLFADELIGEYEAQGIADNQQYCLIPKPDSGQSSDTTTVRRQFSCASFVVEAYRQARIRFLETAADQLPPVTLEILKLAYNRFARLLDHKSFREEKLNLVGDGPWPVLLPGYVLNALVPDGAVIRQNPPYRAVLGDEYFPTRHTSSEVDPEIPTTFRGMRGEND